MEAQRLQESDFNNLLVQQPSRLEDIKRVINKDPQISLNLPTHYYRNPVTGRVIVSCDKRGFRPHTIPTAEGKPKCPICTGDTTPIIFYEPLGGSNFAFVNENLFPIVSPNIMTNAETQQEDLYGYHFLVWPSTEHKGIHELTPEEHVHSLRLLRTLENFVMEGENLLVIKNKGKPCGNSIDHEHYQAIISNFLSARRIAEERYFQETGISLVDTVRNSQSSVKLADYDSFDVTIPYYIRRGFEVIIAPKENRLRFNDLSDKELLDLSRATVDVTKKLDQIMQPPKHEYGLAYNFVFHLGNIGNMYLEVLPYVQAEGGYEHAGFDANQSTPQKTKESYGDLK